MYNSCFMTSVLFCSKNVFRLRPEIEFLPIVCRALSSAPTKRKLLEANDQRKISEQAEGGC